MCKIRGTISPGNWRHAGYDCKKKEKVVLLQKSAVKARESKAERILHLVDKGG
jgi:hypothetical protein